MTETPKPLALHFATDGEVTEQLEVFRIRDVVERRAQLAALDAYALVSGVGKVNTAAMLTAAFMVRPPGALLNVGLCASLCPALPIGQVVIPNTVVQHDYGMHEGGVFHAARAGTTPRIESPDGTRFVFDESLRSALSLALDVPVADVCLASGDVFIVDEQRARAVGATTGAQLLDMEAGAAAQVCARFAVPCASVKIVSDHADKNGMADYRAALTELRERLTRIVDAVTSTRRSAR